MALEMADDKPSTREPDNVIMRREISKFDILYEECDEGTELNSRVVYRHDGIEEQIEDESDLGIKLVDERTCLETTALSTLRIKIQERLIWTTLAVCKSWQQTPK